MESIIKFFRNQIITDFFLFFTFIFGYTLCFWWKFIPSTIIIIFIIKKKYKSKFQEEFGFKVNLYQFLFLILLIFIVYLMAYFLIYFLTNKYKIYCLPFKGDVSLWRCTPFFQVFNEEIILRVLMLKNIKKMIISSSFFVSAIASTLFTFLHFFLYFYGSNQIGLNPICLATLFLFSFITNLIFLHTNNFLYSYAIHLGWNLKKFDCTYIDALTGFQLKEGDSFNLIEGSKECFTMILCITIIYLVGYVFLKKAISHPLLDKKDRLQSDS